MTEPAPTPERRASSCSRRWATTPATRSTSSWPASPMPLATAEIAETLGAARQHRAPAPRAHARGRAARGRHRRTGRRRPAPAPLLAGRRRAVARARAARLPRAGPHAAPPGRRGRRCPPTTRSRPGASRAPPRPTAPPRRHLRRCAHRGARRARVRPRVRGRRRHGATIAFTHCPFRELAEANPDLVCSLHRGLVEGFVDARGDGEVLEFHDLVDRTPARSRSRRCPGSMQPLSRSCRRPHP